jgi:mycothiol synthase
MSTLFQIHPLNMTEASEAEYAAFNRHSNAIRRERLPDDPAVTLEETIQMFKNIPPFVAVREWCAWDASQEDIIAQGNVVMLRTEENQHLAQFDITVLPAYRRQGLGRRLLALIADAARAENRRLLLTETHDRAPGAAFMTLLGAQKGLEGHVNQLRIGDLDRGLIERWLQQARERAPGYQIGLWDGPYPQDQIEAIARLHDLTNQQPMGSLEIEDQHMTPEELRDNERSIFARGMQRWTIYVMESATGKFAGFTEMGWNPTRPEILNQYMTGVFPEHRNQGLGRWLKAAMLDKVLKDRPEVKVVRTGNADSNAAMLKINNELGFQPYMATALWQIEIDRVQEYLDQADATSSAG